MVLSKSSAFVALLACVAPLAAAPPQRIISTAPGITETLFALGLGNRVVGVTEYCKFPKEVEKIPRIGSWATPNLEAILAARPDLIVLQRTAVHDSTKFRSLGLKTLDVRLNTFADISEAIDLIGAAAGVPERARTLNASIRKQLDDVRARVASRPKTSVMFVVGRNPGTLEGVIAAAGSSYISEVIAIAGGRNIFADSTLGYAKVAHEEILARNPDVIIDMGEHPDAAGIADTQRQAEVALWSRYRSVGAVQRKRVHIVANEMFIVPGPRVGELARELVKLLHPELGR